MPYKCWVPGCHSNYTKDLKARVFSFPRDETLKDLWIKVINRIDKRVPTRASKICEKHFKPEDIVTEAVGYDSKAKVTITVPLSIHRLKSDAVPSIFDSFSSKHHKPSVTTDDCSVIEEAEEIESSIVHKSSVDEHKTDEVMDENTGNFNEKSNSSTNSPILPSPYKNLPTVTVCLKEEDRVIIPKEFRNVIKRSLSTGSNSSNGSSEAAKLLAAQPQPKRRKIEKPAPTVIGRQNDCYCWVCHRENVLLCCMACPRAYHQKCAGELSESSSDWVCPECRRILAAENVDTRSSTLSEISLDKLCALLKLSLNKMKQRAPVAFHQPVSLEHYPLYPHYIIHPMDFSLLEKNIKQKLYGCTEAFLADVKWILHNSCVFNGTQHPLSTNAKSMVKTCEHDMQEIEVCPDCFMHCVIRHKYWFSDVCRKPHPLVWAKLKGFPYWPAKVVRILDGNVDARFFGAHDRAWVPVSQCYHLSKEMPTTSKPKKKGNYETALDELNVHVHLLIQKFGSFEYAPYRTNFDPENKFYMYHGIDIDKAVKDDVMFETRSPMTSEFHSPVKGFLSSADSEPEKRISADSQAGIEQSENILSRSMQTDKAEEPSNSNFILSSKETINQNQDSNIEKKPAPAGVFEVTDENAFESAKRNDVVNISSTNKPQTISDSEQLRKLELALERIKGYVSSSNDADKECDEKDTEAETEDSNKTDSSKEVDKVSEEKIVPLPLINKSKLLPTIDIPNDIPEESSKDNDANILDAAKKNDSFSLKLTETIESCKAKLGISEIMEDEESSDSESVEEVEEEEVENEVEEEEVENEVDEEEVENEVEEEEVENGSLSEEEGSDASTSESEDESNSEMSDTDIETIEDTNDAVIKEAESEKVPVLSPNGPLEKGKGTAVENVVITDNEDKGDDSLIITEPVSVDMSNGESDNEQDSEHIVDKTKEEDSIESESCELPTTVVEKNGCNTIKEVDISDVSVTHDEQALPVSNKTQNNNVQNSEGDFLPETEKENFSKQSKNVYFDNIDKRFAFGENANSLSRKLSCDKRKEDEDDDIYICNSPPRKAPTPPLICLDDGTDTEPETESNSNCTSAQSPFSSRERKIDIPVEKNMYETLAVNQNVVRKLEMRNESLAEEQSDHQGSPLLNNVPNNKSIFGSTGKSLKRKLSSQSSDQSSSDDDDDDIQVLPHVNKLPLTGAKRTFGNRENRHITKTTLISENNSQILTSPLSMNQTDKRLEDFSSAAKESQNHHLGEQAFSSPNKENNEKANDSVPIEAGVPNMDQNSSQLKTFQSPETESGDAMDDKDAEILRLKKKLSYVFTAFQIQHWKNNQEKLELRHNMNLIVMEMRASLEADKKQAIEFLSRTLEREKNRCIEETKKKQWCAYCHQESRYACCWNTSYCTIACQKRHFPDHRSFCTQLKGKIGADNSEAKMKLPTSNTTDPSDTKSKVYVLNMKTASDIAKPSVEAISTGSMHQIPLNKPQIQVVSSKAPLQIVTPASSSSSLQMIPNQNVQLVLANIKATCESTAAADSVVTAKELNFDSAQVIKCVRNRTCNLETAITLLQKKNEESSSNLIKEELKKNEENLEDIYFPSPPKVRFEGFDSVNAEESSAIDEAGDVEKISDSEFDGSEDKMEESATEEDDLIFSDTDDKDNELVNIGHGIEVKAKFLNKCLIYGTTAKRLTRCLVDVLFPDIKLLASCSAFGQKSNVTKLTRAALPARKVSAIIDFVMKRYPDSCRSEIVLAINMKCKEARNIIGKLDTDGNTRKHLLRRLLAKEQSAEPSSSNSSDASSNSNLSIATLSPASAATKNIPNVVCIKSSAMPVLSSSAIPALSSSANPALPSSANVTTSIKSQAGPNILRCSPQILIRPKPITTNNGSTAVIPPSKSPTKERETVKTFCGATAVITPSKSRTKKRAETVKTLLSKSQQFGNLSKDGTKIVMPLEILKAASPNNQTTPQPTPSVSSQRPFIIIGSPVSAMKQASHIAQAPTLSSTITTQK